jgi:hypothetical protein
MWTRRLFEVVLVAATLLAPAAALAEPAPPTPDDPLTPYRNRFKLGMDRYKAGAMAEAIRYWEPVYRELGPQTGYRLAFDLGVAYGEIGDVTRATDRLQAFLDEAAARHARSETLEPIVLKEEDDARARIASYASTRGRIRVETGAVPLAAQVDGDEPRLAGFVAWVTPGAHAVTFAPGTSNAEVRTVEVHAGELAVVAPTPPVPPAPESAAQPPPAPEAPAPEPPPRSPSTTTAIVRPFAPPVLYVSGALTVAATVTAIVLEGEAASLHESYTAEQKNLGVIPEADRSRFATTRTWAYASVGGAVGLGAVTAGLATWYFLGASRGEAAVVPTVDMDRNGASLRVTWRF